MRQLLIKRLILLRAYVLLGPCPQGAGLVDLLPFARLHHFTRLAVFTLFPFFLGHEDGQADVVRILADDALEFVTVEIVVLVIAQMQRDAGAALCPGNGFCLEIARTAADPSHALFGWQTGAARFDCNFVGHDEAGIEPHAKLADQLGIGFLVAGEPVHKVLGSALGDGAQVLNGLLFAHADAVVGNGDGFGRLVVRHAHVEGGLVFVQAGAVECFEAELVGCVGGVAD